MSAESRTAFLDHFRSSNGAVAEGYPDVRAGLLEQARTRGRDVVRRMDAVFSAEMHDAVTRMTAILCEEQEAHEEAMLQMAHERDALADRDRLAAECAALRVSHDGVLTSRSWRATEPLRGLWAMLRR